MSSECQHPSGLAAFRVVEQQSSKTTAKQVDGEFRRRKETRAVEASVHGTRTSLPGGAAQIDGTTRHDLLGRESTEGAPCCSEIPESSILMMEDGAIF